MIRMLSVVLVAGGILIFIFMLSAYAPPSAPAAGDQPLRGTPTVDHGFIYHLPRTGSEESARTDQLVSRQDGNPPYGAEAAAGDVGDMPSHASNAAVGPEQVYGSSGARR